MAKRDKHAKAMKRRQKVARDGKRRDEIKAKREFPEIVLMPNEAPAEFVSAVREAVKQIDFRNEDDFEYWEADYYRRIKAEGEQAEFSIQLTSGSATFRW